MKTSDKTTQTQTTRREFLRTSGLITAGTALAAGWATPGYTAENNTIQVALVGCGGRGTGTAAKSCRWARARTASGSAPTLTAVTRRPSSSPRWMSRPSDTFILASYIQGVVVKEIALSADIVKRIRTNDSRK